MAFWFSPEGHFFASPKIQRNSPTRTKSGKAIQPINPARSDDEWEVSDNMFSMERKAPCRKLLRDKLVFSFTD